MVRECREPSHHTLVSFERTCIAQQHGRLWFMWREPCPDCNTASHQASAAAQAAEGWIARQQRHHRGEPPCRRAEGLRIAQGALC